MRVSHQHDKGRLATQLTSADSGRLAQRILGLHTNRGDRFFRAQIYTAFDFAV